MSLCLALISHQASAERGQAANTILSVGLFYFSAVFGPPLDTEAMEGDKDSSSIEHRVHGNNEAWPATFMCHSWTPLAIVQGTPVFSSEYLRSVVTKQ